MSPRASGEDLSLGGGNGNGYGYGYGDRTDALAERLDRRTDGRTAAAAGAGGLTAVTVTVRTCGHVGRTTVRRNTTRRRRARPTPGERSRPALPPDLRVPVLLSPEFDFPLFAPNAVE